MPLKVEIFDMVWDYISFISMIRESQESSEESKAISAAVSGGANDLIRDIARVIEVELPVTHLTGPYIAAALEVVSKNIEFRLDESGRTELRNCREVCELDSRSVIEKEPEPTLQKIQIGPPQYKVVDLNTIINLRKSTERDHND